MENNLELLRQSQDIIQKLNNAVEILTKENDHLSQTNKELKPKADFYDAVTSSRDGKRMDEVAKILCIPGYGSSHKLFAFLRSEGILLSSDNHWNQPAQKYRDLDYIFLRESKVDINGETVIKLTPMVTQKGIEFIRGRINESFTNTEN